MVKGEVYGVSCSTSHQIRVWEVELDLMDGQDTNVAVREVNLYVTHRPVAEASVGARATQTLREQVEASQQEQGGDDGAGAGTRFPRGAPCLRIPD